MWYHDLGKQVHGINIAAILKTNDGFKKIAPIKTAIEL